MKKLYHLLCATLFVCLTTVASANDSAYYMSGEQLIPLQQTDIAIQKEVLNITRINNEPSTLINSFLVDVDYTFYNPGEPKTILVGFEANAPSVHDKDLPNHHHPYMQGFSAVLNGIELPYQVARIENDTVINDGKISGISSERVQVLVNELEGRSPYKYVYYFKATFETGLNRLQHHYQFNSQSSVATTSELSYVLTAANRWKNKQIDDFTLNIYWKKPIDLMMENTFFTDSNDWVANGKLITDIQKTRFDEPPQAVTHFSSAGDTLTFKKNNFHPQGELFLFVPRKGHDLTFTDLGNQSEKNDNCLTDLSLPYEELLAKCSNASSIFTRKVLRNLPFAKRGYIFYDKGIQQYYKKTQSWYQPNPKYKANMKDFSKEEVNWVKHWKKLK